VFESLSGYSGGRFSFGINIAEPHVYNGNPIPTLFWESAKSEPHIIYEGKRYSAREYIAEFLPSAETDADGEESV
jgi:hypothetical protein